MRLDVGTCPLEGGAAVASGVSTRWDESTATPNCPAGNVIDTRRRILVDCRWHTIAVMCRNITTLRGLEPVATSEEIEAAALQYVRKVAGIGKVSAATQEAVDVAVAEIAATTHRLIAELPPRKVPPKTEPPLRRLARQA